MLNMNLFVLAAGLAATASADFCTGPYFSFYNRGGPPMTYAQLDPALFPGQESPHLHSFDGGNGVAADMSFATTQSSSCSTARVKPDKSLYWRPTLFWNGNNTGFYKVPEKFLKVYYKFMDGAERANVTEFPENFQMMVGDPFKRAEGDNPGNVKWACLADDYSRIDSLGFPKGFTSCGQGLTAEVTFPSCWNGKELDPKNPSAHMAWQTEQGKGVEVCPKTHNYARLPQIFIEFWYDVSGFNGQYGANDVPWVLSNGDSTGYGFHADFRNGWEKGVLGKAIGETGYCDCGCGCGEEQMKVCFGDANVYSDSDSDFKSCSATPEYASEGMKPLDKLPGCNPIQAGPERATQATGPGCTAAAAPAPSSGAGGNMTSSAQATPTKAGPTGGAASTDMSAPSQMPDASETPASSQEPVSSQKPASSKYHGHTKRPAPTSVNADADAEATDMPTLSRTMKGKGQTQETQVGNVGDDVEVVATPTKTGGSGNTALPVMSLAPADGAAATTAAGGDDICPAPTTVTITPTVYVTAGATGINATSCDAGTVYATVTNTATVTVSAGSHMLRHKRHAHGHKF